MLRGEPSEEMYNYAIQTITDGSDEEPPAIPNGELHSVPTIKPKDLEDFPVKVTKDNYAVLNLGKKIADQLSGVYFKLAYIDEKDNMAIFLGEDNDLNSDWKKGVFKDNFRGVWGSIDGCLVYMELSDETDDYQFYAVPILLNSEEYVLSVSYNYKLTDYKILGARKAVDKNGKADKFLRKLKIGDVIEPTHYVITDLEKDDDPQPMQLEKLTVTADTKFEETELGDGKYMFMFEMKDMRNNSYDSEAVMFSVENGEIEISK